MATENGRAYRTAENNTPDDLAIGIDWNGDYNDSARVCFWRAVGRKTDPLARRLLDVVVDCAVDKALIEVCGLEEHTEDWWKENEPALAAAKDKARQKIAEWMLAHLRPSTGLFGLTDTWTSMFSIGLERWATTKDKGDADFLWPAALDAVRQLDDRQLKIATDLLHKYSKDADYQRIADAILLLESLEKRSEWDRIRKTFWPPLAKAWAVNMPPEEAGKALRFVAAMQGSSRAAVDAVLEESKSIVSREKYGREIVKFLKQSDVRLSIDEVATTFTFDEDDELGLKIVLNEPVGEKSSIEWFKSQCVHIRVTLDHHRAKGGPFPVSVAVTYPPSGYSYETFTLVD